MKCFLGTSISFNKFLWLTENLFMHCNCCKSNRKSISILFCKYYYLYSTNPQAHIILIVVWCQQKNKSCHSFVFFICFLLYICNATLKGESVLVETSKCVHYTRTTEWKIRRFFCCLLCFAVSSLLPNHNEYMNMKELDK